jgi:hypothetical protein
MDTVLTGSYIYNKYTIVKFDTNKLTLHKQDGKSVYLQSKVKRVFNKETEVLVNVHYANLEFYTENKVPSPTVKVHYEPLESNTMNSVPIRMTQDGSKLLVTLLDRLRIFHNIKKENGEVDNTVEYKDIFFGDAIETVSYSRNETVLVLLESQQQELFIQEVSLRDMEKIGDKTPIEFKDIVKSITLY